MIRQVREHAPSQNRRAVTLQTTVSARRNLDHLSKHTPAWLVSSARLASPCRGQSRTRESGSPQTLSARHWLCAKSNACIPCVSCHCLNSASHLNGAVLCHLSSAPGGGDPASDWPAPVGPAGTGVRPTPDRRSDTSWRRARTVVPGLSLFGH